MNRKKIQRLWREEGLRVPQREAQAATARRAPPSPARAAAGRAAQSRVGARLPVRHHRRRPRAQAAARRRRVHPRSLGDRSRATRSTPTTPSRARPDRRRARRRPELCAGQRPRADRERAARLVPLRRQPDVRSSSPARPGRTRSSSRSAPRPRRGARHRAVRLAARGSRRSLKIGETSTTTNGPTAASAGRPRPPTPLPGDKPDNTTLITTGPTNGGPRGGAVLGEQTARSRRPLLRCAC